jgi:hypothetical protein
VLETINTRRLNLKKTGIEGSEIKFVMNNAEERKARVQNGISLMNVIKE